MNLLYDSLEKCKRFGRQTTLICQISMDCQIRFLVHQTQSFFLAMFHDGRLNPLQDLLQFLECLLQSFMHRQKFRRHSSEFINAKEISFPSVAHMVISGMREVELGISVSPAYACRWFGPKFDDSRMWDVCATSVIYFDAEHLRSFLCYCLTSRNQFCGSRCWKGLILAGKPHIGHGVDDLVFHSGCDWLPLLLRQTRINFKLDHQPELAEFLRAKEFYQLHTIMMDKRPT